MKCLPLACAAALALTLLPAAPAAAQQGRYDYYPNINYTYLDVGLEFIDYNDGNDTGVLLKGSFATMEGVRVLGEIVGGSGDYPGGSYDYTDLTVGVGAFMPLSRGGATTTMDWTAAYLHSDMSDAWGNWTTDGYYLDGGIRTLVAPQMELNGGLRYREVEGSDSFWIRFGMVLASPVTGHGFSFQYLASDAPSNPSVVRLSYRIQF